MTSTLRRELRVFDATMLGLGSIVGTGVFVSIGIAAGVAGAAVVPAIAIAGLLALCNALSSAQLAAAHPVAGGTYEYGYRLLGPSAGFIAGWMFLCAKSASAATAALGLAAYVTGAMAIGAPRAMAPLAVGFTIAIGAVVLTGMRRTSRVNTVIVAVTIGALIVLVLRGIPEVGRSAADELLPLVEFSPDGLGGLLRASALMFVAYTGYGRIATLGEEVYDPKRTIPRAIVTTLVVSAALYLAVAVVAVCALGAERLGAVTATSAAPLEAVADRLGPGGLRTIVVIGAVTAMLGVLLNLILGLSRVVLAMGRRGDMPRLVARVHAGGTPVIAIVVVVVVIAALAGAGSVEAAWSFSAFTVLVYYAITNLAALRLPAADRTFPRAFAVAGLLGCAGLAFMVDIRTWSIGSGVVAIGLLWRVVVRRAARASAER